MYLIKKVEFDSLENQISKAVCKTTVGVLDCDEETATRWIKEHNPSPDKQYKGWDGKIYPYYTKTPISVIDI